MTITSQLNKEVRTHTAVLHKTITESGATITEIASAILQCYRRGNKMMLCGNGGSAADAQHIAAEFVNRFRIERSALPAIALTTDTSILTAIGNDSSYENIFSRQIEALTKNGDIVVGISTSGNSANVLKALDVARVKGAITIGFTGGKGQNNMRAKCDHCLVVPSIDTARIQEIHEFIWHVICNIVENQIYL